jgi:hypothetical protein
MFVYSMATTLSDDVSSALARCTSACRELPQAPGACFEDVRLGLQPGGLLPECERCVRRRHGGRPPRRALHVRCHAGRGRGLHPVQPDSHPVADRQRLALVVGLCSMVRREEVAAHVVRAWLALQLVPGRRVF